MLSKILPATEQKKREALAKQIRDDKRFAQLNNLEVINVIRDINLSTHQSTAMVYREIATFLLNSGQPEIAKDYFQLSLKDSFNPITYSLYLQCLLLMPSCTEKDMFNAAKKFKAFHVNLPTYKHYSQERDPTKKLNVAYVAQHFHSCISASLLVPFIKAHDHDQVKIFCYSDADKSIVPEEIKRCADVWRDVKEKDDASLAKIIYDDNIDILLELNGHIGRNRYGVVARKPAPIQISYFNFSATTGVKGFDYILAGDETDFSEVKHYYTEKIYFLPGSKNAVQFKGFPDPGKLPYLKNGYITFGSFGEAQKVNHAVIKLWCNVLRAIPDAKFYMKASVLRLENFLSAFQKLFREEGIALDRVCFEGPSEHKDMLACYAKVDIALDTFPHGGGTTTMEALWQGIPVISLYGKRFAWQYGKMILSCIKHAELVAYSENEFIKKAVELASDKSRLMHYRQQLREDFRQSERADVASFARKMEKAYRDMWQRYCR